MSLYRLTPAAQKDLSSIWDFTQDRWDAQQAEKYIREIQAAVERVASSPDRGVHGTRSARGIEAMRLAVMWCSMWPAAAESM